MPSNLPALPDFNLVDVLILLGIALYVFEDARRGVLYGLLDLVGFGLALVVALAVYAPLASWLVAKIEFPYSVVKPLAFGLAWLGSDLVFTATLRRAAAPSARAVAASQTGRLLGVVTGAARGLVAAVVALAAIGGLPLPPAVGQAINDSPIGSHLSGRGQDLQRALGDVFGDAVQDTVAMLTVRPESSERVNLPFRVAEPRFDPPAEERMLELVNQARATAGVGPLELDPAIRDVARAYSTEMFQRGFFSHVDLEGGTPFDRMRRGGVRFSAAGENLALAPTVEIAHQGLMNSPGHRANILNGRFRRIGIGAVSGGMHGRMFTQNFAD